VKRLHVDEIESLPLTFLGLQWKPVRQALDVSAFGINAYHGPNEGDLVVEEHADRHQELYLVLRGSARFRSDEEEFEVPAGTFVLFEPQEHRVAHAAEADTIVLAVGAEAERFEPSAWEYSFRAKALLDLGRVDEALEVVEAGQERYPEREDILYTTACIEATRGDNDTAWATLARAGALNPVVLDWAREEAALAPIRDRL
jgi:mannose-6-phosphate isomerase-like protein (cupin superfamily)